MSRFSNHQTRQTLSRKLVCQILALTLFFSFLSPALLAQELDPTIPTKQAAALNAIANVMADSSDRVGQELKDYGYQPANEAMWHQLPVVRQLEAAYLAFEKTEKKGGAKFLALLSSDLAKRYHAIRFEPALKSYLDIPPSPLRPTGSTKLPELKKRPPVEVARAIETIAQYCEGNAFGGTYGVLTNHFGLSGQETYEILRSAGSNAEALNRGLDRVNAQARHQVLTDLVSEIDHTYGHTARAESSLDPFRPPKRKDAAVLPPIYSDGRGGPPVGSGSTGGTGGTGGTQGNKVRPLGPSGSGGNGASIPRPDLPQIRRSPLPDINRSYTGFLGRNHGTKARRSFIRMTRTGRGFGGVVFGSPTEAQPAISDLKFIDWVPSSSNKNDSQPMSGRLIFRRAPNAPDSSAFVFGPVLQEDVHIAEKIVYGKFDDLPDWDFGEGIGLTGIDEPVPYFDIGEEGLVNKGRRWRVLLHPALVDSKLGWAALMVDVLPIHEHHFTNLFAKNVEESDLLRLKKWLATRPYSWKFTDVPVRITTKNAKLFVERQPSEINNYPQELRAVAFLDVLDASGESNSSFSKDFYPLVPLIAGSSEAHDRLNRFAGLLALLRWAKTIGATVRTSAERPPDVPTPESVVVTSDGFIVAPTYLRETAGKELRDKLDRRLLQLSEHFSSEVQMLLDRTRQELRTLTERQEEISAQERLNSTQYQTILDEINDSIESLPPATRLQMEALRTQWDQEYRQLQLARDENEEAQARKRIETARARLNDFSAATFPQQSQKQQVLRQREKEVSALRRDYSRELLYKLAIMAGDQRKVETALVASAPQQTQQAFESVSASLATLRRENAEGNAKLKDIDYKRYELTTRLNEKLDAASVEIQKRYDALLSEELQIIVSRSRSQDEETRSKLEFRLKQITAERDDILAKIAPEDIQERRRLTEMSAPLESRYKDIARQIADLELKKQELLKQISPELNLWWTLTEAYFDTIVR